MTDPFVNVPRYRASGEEIPVMYIELTQTVIGIPPGPIAQIYLNDVGSRARNPSREGLAKVLLKLLNDAVRAHQTGLLKGE